MTKLEAKELQLKKDTCKTIVVFRKFKSLDDIIALFPELNEFNETLCDSYQHVGQHSAAQYKHCINISIPAKPKEYAALKLELEQIGYNLDIRKRYVKKGIR